MKNVHSLSLPYRVTYVSDENQAHKAQNIVNKNPQTFWRTSRPFEEARFEATFTSIHITNIEITTPCCPQIEIEVFNKSQFGEELDNMRYLEKNDIITQDSFIENTEISRVRNIKPFDEEYMKDKYFTCIRVYLYNPYHDIKPVCLGLNSMIIYGIPESLVNIKSASTNVFHERSNNAFQRGDTINIDNTQPEEPESLITKFGQKTDLKKTHKNRYYPNDSADNSRNFEDSTKEPHDLWDPDVLTDNFPETKRVKKSVEKTNTDPTKDINVEIIQTSPNDFETEGVYNKLLQQNKMRQTERQREGYYQDNTKNRKPLNDDDELQRAMQLSKESFAKEKHARSGDEMNIESIEGVKLRHENTEEVTGLEYSKLLDKYDNLTGREDDVSLEEEYNQASNRIDDIPDDLTEPLESELGDEDLLEGLQNEEMEEPIYRKDQSNSNSNQVIRDLRPVQRENSNKSQNKYWDHRNHGQGYGGQEMWKLEARELSDQYLKTENQVKRGIEKGTEKTSEVQVTTKVGDPLKDVVFSLSGFGNPERQILKDNANEMGARYRDDLFDGMTTHLICREKNKGKYEMAKKFKNKIWIVKPEWIETCYLRRKRIDERYYELK